MIAPAPILPPYVTPAELASHFAVSERMVREKAQSIGACCIMGKKMVHLQHHVEMLLEAFQPCHSKSSNAVKSGTTEDLLPEGNYAALQARLKKPMPNGSKRKSSKERGTVVSMGRGPG